MAAGLLNEAVAREVDQTVTLLRTLQGEAMVNASLNIRQVVELLTNHMDKLSEQLTIMDPLYHPQSKRNEAVDIRRAVYDVLVSMQHRLIETRVQVSLEGYDRQALTAHISRGYLMQALMIIVTNLLEAISFSSHLRKISVDLFSGVIAAIVDEEESEGHGLLMWPFRASSPKVPEVAANTIKLDVDPLILACQNGQSNQGNGS